jgi:cell division protein FtsW
MKETRHRPDFILLFVVILLTFIGLVAIYSASTIVSYRIFEKDTDHIFLRQLIWVVLGLFLMVFAMNIHYRVWFRLSRLILLSSYFFLGLVLIPGVGIVINGARRWLSYGGLSFQPSDYAMFGIIIYLAYLLTKKQDRIENPKASFWPSMVLIGIGFLLIMLEPDMDTAITFAACPFLMMMLAGVPKRYTRMTIVLAVLALLPLALVGYRGERIWAWFDPWAYKDTIGYQVIQSLYAISTGGWTGRGLGHSVEKFSYLPEPHTDFVFAVLSEEWGFIGGLFLIALFAVLIWRGIYIATHVRDRFAALVAVGFTTMIGIATFFNIGSVSGLLPVIGVPLPFISYGGTSLLIKMIAMGILLNISRYTVEEDALWTDPGTGARKKAPMQGATIPLRGSSRFDA